jgi:hypothetical protein
MTFSIRHIILLFGILFIILSFYWFGRDNITYDIIILAGLVIFLFSFLIILFKDTRKSKLLWTFVVFASAGLQRITEPVLIKLSYKHFIIQHESSLNSVTGLIQTKTNNLFLSPTSDLWTKNGFTQEERNQICGGLKETGISFIIKDSSKIFYLTWGVLDEYHGIYYFFSGDQADERYRHILGNWYYR